MSRKKHASAQPVLQPIQWCISHRDNATGEFIRSEERYTLINAADICRELNTGPDAVYWITLVKE